MEATKKDAYQLVTDRMIAQLEKGTVPWHRPWSGPSGIPKNLHSGKAYNGINAFVLHCCQFESNYFLTFKQAQERGGNVRKGEKGIPVVYWNWIDITDKSTGEKSKVPFLKYYTVFNVSQCEGIDAPKGESIERNFNAIEEAERITKSYKSCPEVKYGKQQAYYSPVLDYINMPAKNSFRSDEEYYSTLFHEMAHSTGHSSRLNRKGITETTHFGSSVYSREELVAEMAASFLCGNAGILDTVFDNSAAYVSGWLKVLKGDNKILVTAAGQAQKAADYILGKKSGEEA